MMTRLRTVPASHPSVPNTLKHLGTLYEVREDTSNRMLGYVGRRNSRAFWLCASESGIAGNPCWQTRELAQRWFMRRNSR